jgi:hypothetical protein
MNGWYLLKVYKKVFERERRANRTLRFGRWQLHPHVLGGEKARFEG